MNAQAVTNQNQQVQENGKTVTRQVEVSKQPVRGSQSQAYKQLLNEELEGISNACSEIGATDGKGGSQKAHHTDGAKDPSGISKKKEQQLIKNGPIFLALLVVLFTGDDSSYHTLANDMGNLSKLMKELKKYGGDVQDIEDEINKLMKGDSGESPQQIAQDITKDQADLQKLLKEHGGSLSKGLVQAIDEFSKPGGTLDQLVKEATQGMNPPCNSWADAANNPQALQKIKQYLTQGGAPGKGASSVFSKISSLLGSINTANQGDVEKLNLMTKKVDSATKLMAAAITVYKGIIQTLTNYSGS